MNQRKKIFIVIGILALVIGFAYFYNTHVKPVENVSEIQKAQEVAKNSATIIAGDLKVEAEFKNGSTLLDFMRDQAAKNTLTMNGKDYPKMGFFITDVGDLHNGENGKYLTYTVNDQEVPVGAGAYYLKDKDIIKWELK